MNIKCYKTCGLRGVPWLHSSILQSRRVIIPLSVESRGVNEQKHSITLWEGERTGVNESGVFHMVSLNRHSNGVWCDSRLHVLFNQFFFFTNRTKDTDEEKPGDCKMPWTLLLKLPKPSGALESSTGVLMELFVFLSRSNIFPRGVPLSYCKPLCLKRGNMNLIVGCIHTVDTATEILQSLHLLL